MCTWHGVWSLKAAFACLCTGMWLHLNNQRICLLNVLEIARMLGLKGHDVTVVLPKWQVRGMAQIEAALLIL